MDFIKRFSRHSSASAPPVATPPQHVDSIDTPSTPHFTPLIASPIPPVPRSPSSTSFRSPSPTSARALADTIVPRAGPGDIISQNTSLGPVSGYIGVDWEAEHQVMEGMGGSITWYGGWALAHPARNEIFDAVFSDLRPSILRVRNTFGQGSDDDGEGGQTTAQLMEETAIVVHEGRKRLSGRDAFKILMCSWSPPVALKASGVLNGAGSSAGEADTLKKDKRGVFLYREFAQYWLVSLRRYQQIGVEPDWISIQNEPEWSTKYHPVCSFRPAEDYFYPGYYRAFEEVHSTLRDGLPNQPEMIGPECSGFDNFITAPLNGRKEGYQASPFSGDPRVSAICNHLYDAGVQYSDERFYEKLDVSLKNVRRQADESMTRRVFMTEFANLSLHEYTDPLDLAKTIYQTLTVADANCYLIWDLLWGKSPDGEGSLLVMENPYNGDIGRSNSKGYEITMSYYWFKHFCRFIRPEMQRIGVKDKSRSLDGILPLIFVSKVIDGSSTCIFINTTSVWSRVQCGYLPNPVRGRPRKVYYSTLDEGFVYAGQFPEKSTKIWLKPNSITSLHSGIY